MRDVPAEMQQENRMGIGNYVNFFFFFFCRVLLFALCVSLDRYMIGCIGKSCSYA